jgi:hypothetical protein
MLDWDFGSGAGREFGPARRGSKTGVVRDVARKADPNFSPEVV